MAGNSQRRGAIQKANKKGATTGSGGQRRRGLEGKGPTPKAKDRPYHKAYRSAELAERKMKWKAPKARYPKGVLAKYAKLVSSASTGAVTDKI